VADFVWPEYVYELEPGAAQVKRVKGLYIIWGDKESTKLDPDKWRGDEVRERFPYATEFKEVIIEWDGERRELTFDEFKRRIFNEEQQ
jgi:hypothetical protein